MESFWRWWSAAIDEAQEGRWVRNATERRVIADIVAATGALSGGRMPPFTGDPMDVRVKRIAEWATVVRAAARAGGWEIHTVAGHPAGPPFIGSAGMAELLSALLAIGQQGDLWRKQVAAGGLPPERAVAEVECLLAGPGSVEDLELFFYD
ncbi:hypothetical protein [Actinoplanes sp. NPDC023714]|uniref:hypothetical protein n=1 Tax=Actinoplanes sp. NPDC023714 TaxID=3154322 RepID=UPI0033C0201A